MRKRDCDWHKDRKISEYPSFWITSLAAMSPLWTPQRKCQGVPAPAKLQEEVAVQTSWEFSDSFYGCSSLSSRHRHVHLSSSCQLSFLTANKLSLGQLNFQEACQGIAFISIKRNEMGKKKEEIRFPPERPSCSSPPPPRWHQCSFSFPRSWEGLILPGSRDEPSFCLYFPPALLAVNKSHVLQCQAVPLCELG